MYKIEINRFFLNNSAWFNRAAVTVVETMDVHLHEISVMWVLNAKDSVMGRAIILRLILCLMKTVL
jgi:hypothetical protein